MERENVQPLADALTQKHDWAAFTSPAGVHAAVHALKKLGRDLRALYGMQLAAIGRGTADAMAGYGLAADLIPAQYDGEHLADALIETVPQGGAVLLLRAAAGGHILPETLKAAGVHVTDVPLYDTEYRCAKADELRAMLEAGAADVVTFTSMSTVEGFAQAVGAADYTGFTALCIGEQTAQAARKYNMNVKIAESATIDAMIACLLEES